MSCLLLQANIILLLNLSEISNKVKQLFNEENADFCLDLLKFILNFRFTKLKKRFFIE